MTGGTIFGRCFFVINDILRHVRLVTLLAVGSCLLGEVSFMALGAVRDLAVGVVAGTAVKGGMLALVVAQLDDLAGMAGYAGVGDVIAEFDVERGMRIRVTAIAGSQFEVWFSFMALAAERDDLARCRRVAVVTILSADLALVFTTGCSDIRRCFAVTFGTVIIQQLHGWSRNGRNRRLCRGVGGDGHTLNREKGKSGQQNNPYSFQHAALFHLCYLLCM